jgi:hypothetical protein
MPQHDDRATVKSRLQGTGRAEPKNPILWLPRHNDVQPHRVPRRSYDGREFIEDCGTTEQISAIQRQLFSARSPASRIRELPLGLDGYKPETQREAVRSV